MSGETALTVAGNLAGEVELRYTPSGAAVASFTVASTPRKYNATTKQWEDGDTLFLRCSLWRAAAEHLANSLSKGARVLVTGTLRQRSYETKDGETRTVIELDADEAGASLKYTTAKIVTAERTSTAAPGAGADQDSGPVAGEGDAPF